MTLLQEQTTAAWVTVTPRALRSDTPPAAPTNRLQETLQAIWLTVTPRQLTGGGGGTDFEQDCNETVALVDPSAPKATTHVLTDALALVDGATRAMARSLAESAVLADTITRAMTRSVSEQLALDDSVSKAMARALTDVVATLDGVTILRLFLKELTEALVLSDPRAILTVGKTLTEIASLADAKSASLLRALLETISAVGVATTSSDVVAPLVVRVAALLSDVAARSGAVSGDVPASGMLPGE